MKKLDFRRNERLRKQISKGVWRMSMHSNRHKRFRRPRISSRLYSRSNKNWRPRRSDWRSWHDFKMRKRREKNEKGKNSRLNWRRSNRRRTNRWTKGEILGIRKTKKVMSNKSFNNKKPRKHHRKADLDDSRIRRKRNREMMMRYRRRSSLRMMSMMMKMYTFSRTLPSIINQELFLRHL